MLYYSFLNPTGQFIGGGGQGLQSNQTGTFIEELKVIVNKYMISGNYSIINLKFENFQQETIESNNPITFQLQGTDEDIVPPQILNHTQNFYQVSTPGYLGISLFIESKSNPGFIYYNLVGPNNESISGGGGQMEAIKDQINQNLWIVNLPFYFYQCSPGGNYTISGIVSQNLANIMSNQYSDLTVNVDNSSCTANGSSILIDRAFFTPQNLTGSGKTFFYIYAESSSMPNMVYYLFKGPNDNIITGGGGQMNFEQKFVINSQGNSKELWVMEQEFQFQDFEQKGSYKILELFIDNEQRAKSSVFANTIEFNLN